MNISLKNLLFFLTLVFFTGIADDTQAAKPVKVKTEKRHSSKVADPPRKNKLAVWSLVLSGAGFLVTAIPYLAMISPYLIAGGIVCGILALSQIKKTKEKGKGLAVASLVLGGTFLVVAIVAIAILLSLFQ
jgi:4-hydroxybenzoate polyprenyltransferase